MAALSDRHYRSRPGRQASAPREKSREFSPAFRQVPILGRTALNEKWRNPLGIAPLSKERAMGLEPTTSSLGSLGFTTRIRYMPS
jgi:hypothetical protein